MVNNHFRWPGNGQKASQKRQGQQKLGQEAPLEEFEVCESSTKGAQRFAQGHFPASSHVDTTICHHLTPVLLTWTR